MNKIAVIGSNHLVAPLSFREQLAFREQLTQANQVPIDKNVPVSSQIGKAIEADLKRLGIKGKTHDQLQSMTSKYQIHGTVTLSTCNRVEIYASLPSDESAGQLSDFLEDVFQLNQSDITKYTYLYEGLPAILHLFRVSASLDSMILGEPQILGQIKSAYEKSLTSNTTDLLLNRLFAKAISFGKQVRTETNVASGVLSISYAAVELAKQKLGSLANKTVVIIGAGKMSELTVKHLVENGASRVIVVNRSCERAERVAEMFNGTAMVYQPDLKFLTQADIVISSTTAPHYVVQPCALERVMEKRPNQPMLLIDIAVPRDIDPESEKIEQVHLYNIDALQEVVTTNREDRQKEAKLAENIASEEAVKFHKYLKTLGVTPTIKLLNQKFQQIADQELERSIKKALLDTEQEAVITTMLKSLIKKLLDSPTRHLRQTAMSNDSIQQVDLLRELFRLDENPDSNLDTTTREE